MTKATFCGLQARLQGAFENFHGKHAEFLTYSEKDLAAMYFEAGIHAAANAELGLLSDPKDKAAFFKMFYIRDTENAS